CIPSDKPGELTYNSNKPSAFKRTSAQRCTMLKRWLARATEERQVFFYLLGYRWLSLLPPFLALILMPGVDPWLQPIFVAALADNLFLTLLYPQVNRWVTRFPVILGIDLTIVAIFLALTGNTASLFYLYALSPILAAAFFFRMRGALSAAFTFTIFYAAFLTQSGISINLLHALTQTISVFLIAVLFGYSAILIEDIRNDRALLAQGNATLERTNRELASVHTLALQMQSSAVDVADIEEVILTTITQAMGFERAMLALVDPERNALIGWLTHCQDEAAQGPTGIFHTSEIPLVRESGVMAQAVLNREPAYVEDGLPPTNDPSMNRRLRMTKYAILPLYMRDNAIGVLLVDNPESGAPITSESMHSLKLVADQAAIALGSTKLCIERAQRLAVEEERNRIAMEIHDTATQSLFGIVYTLDGCIKRLAENPEEVEAKLVDLRTVANRTMNDLRHSVYEIWAGTLTEADFRMELESYFQKLGAPASLSVDINIQGSFGALDTAVRRNLLRIAAEGLANIVKHAGATRASVTLDLLSQRVCLVIEDDGTGFEMRDGSLPSTGIGLISIRERAHALGAEAQIETSPGKGTRIRVELGKSLQMGMESETDANPACG
ncbi:MAG: histidine kinase, partial [Acidobacteriota bacterium]